MGGPGSGRGGISAYTLQAAEKLLEEGWGVYRIAKKLGLDDMTVYKIKAGTHFLQQRVEDLITKRCEHCGGKLIELPCRLCAIRRAGL